MTKRKNNMQPSKNTPPVWKIGSKPGIPLKEFIEKALAYGFSGMGQWGANLGNLKKYEGNEKIKKRLAEEGMSDRASPRHSKELWTFADKIKKGHYILQYLGGRKLHLGRVKKSYYYVKKGSSKDYWGKKYPHNAPHRIDVEWLYGKRQFEGDFSWNDTVHEVTEKDLSKRMDSKLRIILSHYFKSYRPIKSRPQAISNEPILLGPECGAPLDNDKAEPTKEETRDFLKGITEPRSPEEAIRILKQISKSLINKPIAERIKKSKILSRNLRFAKLIKEKQKYICEICGARPFEKKNRELYAEAHHILELAKSRIDDPNQMICVCPTCHRVIHYGCSQALKERKKLLAHISSKRDDS